MSILALDKDNSELERDLENLDKIRDALGIV